jgi:hypothetical protein
MAVKTETLSAPSGQPTGQPGSAREYDLDRDRTASMADEGGVAGALVDLREQLEEIDDTLEDQGRQAWARSLVWGGAALGVAALVVAAFWMRRR